jgi:hypothetical protein
MKIFVSKKIILGGLLAIVMAFSWASFSLAAPLAGNNNIVFENPLQQHDTVDTLLAALLDRLQGIIVIISMVFIVIGGLLYMTSAGNESRMTMAKGAILASVIGLAIGVAAPSFIKEIYLALGNSAPAEVVASPSIGQIALNVLNFLLGIVGIIAIIMLVLAGMMYLTSAGSESRIETAKKMTTWSVVGIAIALAALIIVRQVANFFT